MRDSIILKAKKKRPRWPWFLLLLILAGTGYGFYRNFNPELPKTDEGEAAAGEVKEELNDSADRTFRVERGDFNITVLADGSLDAIKRYDLRCEVKRFEKRVIFVIEDRTKVKKGDVIIKLDGQELADEKERLEDDLDTAKQEYMVAQENMKMTKAENLQKIKNAADELRTANETFEKYFDLEASDKREDLKTKIDDGRDKVSTKETELSDLESEAASADNQDEDTSKEYDEKIDKAEDELKKAEQELETARKNYYVFRQYDDPKKMRELERSTSSKQLNLRNVVMRAANDMVQAERNVQRKRRRIKKLEDDLEQVIKDISNLILTAPVDGICTLGNPNRRHWQDPKEWKVGTTVNTREVVASIPDLSRFVVEVDIPEEFRSRIREDMVAYCKSPAIPDLTIDGKISEIASMATNIISWDRNSPKVYKTKISTDMTDPRLMPGMTVNVEIVSESVTGVIYVPVEALYNREGKTLCRKSTGGGSEEIEVKTGRSSIHYVEVTEGLEEGDEVLLFREAGGGTGGNGKSD